MSYLDAVIAATVDYLNDPFFPYNSFGAKLLLLPAALSNAVRPSTHAQYKD